MVAHFSMAAKKAAKGGLCTRGDHAVNRIIITLVLRIVVPVFV